MNKSNIDTSSDINSTKLIPQPAAISTDREDNFYHNTKQDIIIITQDRIKIILTEYIAQIEKKKEWISWIGTAITLLIVLVTTDTKNIFGLSASVWTAVFIISFLVVLFCTLKAIFVAFKSKTYTIDSIIREMKKPNQ
jgi:LPS O-antigen subunit length determinant protein (WzzB/FepE family)